MFRFTNIVMYYAPIGVGAAMAYTVGHMGMSVLLPLAKLLLTAWGGLLAFVVLVFLPIVLIARLPLGRFLKAVAEPATIAFATSTSEAALPRAMESMEEFGVPREIVAFVIPAGYSFNLDGSTLYLAMASIFVAQAAGLVGVPAVIADQVRAMRRNVLGELGQKVQRGEDLEIPLRAGFEAVSMWVGEGPTSVLLRLVDDLPGLGHLDQARSGPRRRPTATMRTPWASCCGATVSGSWQASRCRVYGVSNGPRTRKPMIGRSRRTVYKASPDPDQKSLRIPQHGRRCLIRNSLRAEKVRKCHLVNQDSVFSSQWR